MRVHWCLPSERKLAKAEPDWLLMLVYNNSLEVLANLFMPFWHTWNIRNKVIHEGTPPFIASSVTFLTRYMDSLLIIRQQGRHEDLKGKRSVTPSVGNIQKQEGVKKRIQWRLPLQGTFKINVDAAFNPLSGDAAVGVRMKTDGIERRTPQPFSTFTFEYENENESGQTEHENEHELTEYREFRKRNNSSGIISNTVGIRKLNTEYRPVDQVHD